MVADNNRERRKHEGDKARETRKTLYPKIENKNICSGKKNKDRNSENGGAVKQP